MNYCKFDRVQEFGSQLLHKMTRPFVILLYYNLPNVSTKVQTQRNSYFFFKVMVRFIWSPVASTSKDTSDDASESERGSRRRWLNVAWIKLENITSPVNPSTLQIDFFFCLTKRTQLPLSQVVLSRHQWPNEFTVRLLSTCLYKIWVEGGGKRKSDKKNKYSQLQVKRRTDEPLNKRRTRSNTFAIVVSTH